MSASLSNARRTPRNAFAGTGSYLRFTVKHNLARYLVWIAVVVGMLGIVISYYQQMFPDTVAGQTALKDFIAIANQPSMMALVGKVGSVTLGGAVYTKIWMSLAMTLCIGMVFQVTKGARADEENGRTELFRSRPFGIHSTLASVVGGSLLLCLVIGILSTLICIGMGVDESSAGITGSVVMGLSLTACGMFGVGVGALTNQLSASATLANSTGSIAVVFFYVLRMMGDMKDNALIWFSPIGWGERMMPWGDNKGWLFIPAVAVTAVLIAAAFIIEARRDYGSGVLKEKKGKSEAKKLMRRSWGLTLHLHKGSIIGWSIGMLLAGLLLGSVAKSMLDMLSNVNLAMIKDSSLTSLLGFLLCFIGLVAMVLPLQIMVGLRTDEAKGLTESQLAGGISRGRLVLERLAVSFGVLVFLLLLGGVAMGASYGAVVGDMSYIGKLVEGALVYAPGIMAVVGIAVLLFGFFPRATIPVTWFVYGAIYFILLASDAMRLPDWVKNIMPMTGTMTRMMGTPLGTFDAAELWFAAAAVVFIVLGMIGLRKRDVPR